MLVESDPLEYAKPTPVRDVNSEAVGIPVSWADKPARKTQMMRDMETTERIKLSRELVQTQTIYLHTVNPAAYDIRTIILRALAAYDRDRDSAHSLSLTPSTLSIWISKLGIIDLAHEVRQHARQSDTNAA